MYSMQCRETKGLYIDQQQRSCELLRFVSTSFLNLVLEMD
jgi:hypothetical protein